jgi:hypothetical protein
MQTASIALSSSDLRPRIKHTRQSHGRQFVLWAVCAVFAAIGFFTANGLITSVAFLTLPILVHLLWREGEPPVLLCGCIFQWLQATAAVFYTNHYGETLDEAFGSNVLSVATWLSLLAVPVLAVGIRCGLFAAGNSQKSELESDAAKMDVRKIAVLYAAIAIVATGLTAGAFHFTSITQLLLAIASLKWAAVFLLCYTVLHQRQGYGLLLACIGVEFALGLFGVFANFKSVFFVLVVAAMSSSAALRGRRLVATSVCFVLLFIMGVVWSAVKMDYREFLAATETGNDEVIPIERKFGKLADLIESVTWENFTDGMDALIMRISYVNYFAMTVENVPARVPYANGALWNGAIMHILTPRLLFPDKPSLDDSERTRTYTGLEVAGMESGTSIGIGYVGESYVDYGPIWMFVPIFFLGLLYGLIYRFFIMRTRYKLIGASLAVSALVFNAYEIEVSNVKLVGGVMAAALIAGVFYNLFGATIAKFIQRLPPRGAGVRRSVAKSRIA